MSTTYDRTAENLEAGTGEIVCLADVPNDPRIRAAAESAYRRGFYQGAAAAVEGVEAGMNLRKLEGWLNRLMAWRQKRHKGTHELPEWIARRPTSATPPPTAASSSP